MPHNEFHPEMEHMKNRASKFSLAGADNPIFDTMEVQEGTPQYNRGLSLGDATSSPFVDSANAPTDHLADLLTGDAESTRLNATSPAQSAQYMGPGPQGDLDLEGEQPEVFTAGLGQNDGKKLNGKDLHVELMQGTYTYSHGEGTPWQSTAQVGDTPSLSPFQDLTNEFVTGPLGDPADKIPSWNYFSTGPDTAFNG